MASPRTRTGLLILALLTFTAAAAAQVEFNPGTIARVGNADINLTGLSERAERVEVMSDNVTIGDLTLNVSSTQDIEIDMEIFKREAVSDGLVARFVADAAPGTTATFAFDNLIAGQTYNVSRDSAPFLLQESSDGTLTFSASEWSPHTFTVQMLITGGLSTSQDTITTFLGETVTSALLLTNPKEETDTYSIRVDTSMTNGNAAVTLDTGEEEGDTVTVDVGAESTRSITINVEGSSCLSTACRGSATFIATSQTTDERYTEPVNIVIQRNTRIHGSPGLTLPYLFVIAVLASIAILFRG